MVDDLNIDAALKCAIERAQDRLVSEFIGAYAQGFIRLRAVDVFQTGFGESARQPFGFRVQQLAGVTDIIRHLVGEGCVMKFGLERMAGNRTAIEPDALPFGVVFRLGLDGEFKLVSFFERRMQVAVQRDDREIILGPGRCPVVGP